MTLTLVTPPTEEPISVAEAKAHARVDLGTDDALIKAYIATARAGAEEYLGAQLVSATYDRALEAFPAAGDVISLPKWPVTAVSSISYVDGNGAAQTWESSLWQVNLGEGLIKPAYGESYPITRSGIFAAVTVRFVAGYATFEDVPEGIKTALKVHVAELYKNREASISGTIIQPVPYDVMALLNVFHPTGGVVVA